MTKWRFIAVDFCRFLVHIYTEVVVVQTTYYPIPAWLSKVGQAVDLVSLGLTSSKQVDIPRHPLSIFCCSGANQIAALSCPGIHSQLLRFVPGGGFSRSVRLWQNVSIDLNIYCFPGGDGCHGTLARHWTKGSRIIPLYTYIYIENSFSLSFKSKVDKSW